MEMFNRVHRLSLSNNNMIEGVDKNLLIYNRRKFERLKDMEGYIKTKSRELLIKNNENERKSFKYERENPKKVKVMETNDKEDNEDNEKYQLRIKKENKMRMISDVKLHRDEI